MGRQWGYFQLLAIMNNAVFYYLLKIIFILIYLETIHCSIWFDFEFIRTCSLRQLTFFHIVIKFLRVFYVVA